MRHDSIDLAFARGQQQVGQSFNLSPDEQLDDASFKSIPEPTANSGTSENKKDISERPIEQFRAALLNFAHEIDVMSGTETVIEQRQAWIVLGLTTLAGALAIATAHVGWSQDVLINTRSYILHYLQNINFDGMVSGPGDRPYNGWETHLVDGNVLTNHDGVLGMHDIHNYETFVSDFAKQILDNKFQVQPGSEYSATGTWQTLRFVSQESVNMLTKALDELKEWSKYKEHARNLFLMSTIGSAIGFGVNQIFRPEKKLVVSDTLGPWVAKATRILAGKI